MLDKKDLQAIGKMMDDKFSDFWEDLILPYFDRNEKQHQEIKEKIDSMDDHMYEIKDYIKDHEKRIKRLEKAAVTS